ncbi:MAG: metallophosphoesterase family protein [Nitrospinota bacterium]|nr:metallophosphoesterase family protein [Nitrospinota bacterium]MDH5678174.1 metallophosphoesterase family protein [Nitrospinota bacterium]MDH5755841.1 metallophosphoesterase family protein [Nitrospinota bacterium]
MRYALFSDVHSNKEAFEAVLEDIRLYGVDQMLFLGDIVGYGPDPNECMDLLLTVADISLGGNHDWALVGKTPNDYFNPFAKAALDWTNNTLRDDLKDFLKRTRAMDVFNGVVLAHSSPKLPEEWRYVLTKEDAMDNFNHIEGEICFIGHSHQPIFIEMPDEHTVIPIREKFKVLEPGKKYIINVGSVGQPRDSNNKACWLLYDSDLGSVELRRVAYDIEAVQKKMRNSGLPRYLVDRLALGR